MASDKKTKEAARDDDGRNTARSPARRAVTSRATAFARRRGINLLYFHLLLEARTGVPARIAAALRRVDPGLTVEDITVTALDGYHLDAFTLVIRRRPAPGETREQSREYDAKAMAALEAELAAFDGDALPGDRFPAARVARVAVDATHTPESFGLLAAAVDEAGGHVRGLRYYPFAERALRVYEIAFPDDADDDARLKAAITARLPDADVGFDADADAMEKCFPTTPARTPAGEAYPYYRH